ncbi:MAG TPA: hypothetical protein VF720_07245, partial [Candidatus Eisenbacteria bacterium]
PAARTGAPAPRPTAPTPSAPAPQPPGEPMAAAPPPSTDIPSDPGALWTKTIAAVGAKKRSLGAFLAGSRAVGIDPNGRLVIEPAANDPMSREHLEDGDNRRFIEQVLREITGQPVGYLVNAPARPASGGDTGSGGAPESAPRSPFELAADHPIVQKALDLFDGEITS